MTREDEPNGDYTRLRAKVQVGDGPDQRGDRTVEMVRLHDEEIEHREAVPAGDLLTEDELERYGVDPDVKVPRNDSQFAEFMVEVQRTTDLLRNELGLAGEDR
jgi:hypothetical protein